MDIKELGPIGAELTDIDLKSLSNEDVARIKIYFLDHSVIVFKNQNLNPQDLKNISKLWGEALVHPVFKGIEGHPEIIEIKNLGEKYHTNAHWHSDVTFEECPPDATLLYSLEVPEKGGDTLFSCQYLAYDELDRDLKSLLSEKLAIHSNIGVLLLSGGDPNNAKTVEHPIFREHPETGKKALYVTEASVTYKAFFPVSGCSLNIGCSTVLALLGSPPDSSKTPILLWIASFSESKDFRSLSNSSYARY